MFVVFAVRTFYPAIMSRGERTKQFVENLSLYERTPKERKISRSRVSEVHSRFEAIVGLNTIHVKTELFEVSRHMNQELR